MFGRKQKFSADDIYDRIERAANSSSQDQLEVAKAMALYNISVELKNLGVNITGPII